MLNWGLSWNDPSSLLFGLGAFHGIVGLSDPMLRSAVGTFASACYVCTTRGRARCQSRLIRLVPCWNPQVPLALERGIPGTFCTVAEYQTMPIAMQQQILVGQVSFWFHAVGWCFMLAAYAQRTLTVKTGEPAPVEFGVGLMAIGLVGTLLFKLSGFPLLLALGGYTVYHSKQARNKLDRHE